MAGGTLDEGESFRDVVYLEGNLEDSDDGWSCSGTLISPRIVLTAEHCFEHAEGGVEATVFLKIGHEDPAAGTDFFHHFNASGEVLIRQADLDIDPVDNNETARDLALVVLDTAVPRSIATPRHPPSGANTCAEDFTGTMVGYGDPYFSVIDAANTCGDSLGSRRRSMTTEGWTRSDQGDYGSVYLNEWSFAVTTPCVYEGGTEGDSGGPLLDDAGNLCGVVSVARPYFVHLPPAWPIWHVEDAVAGVDNKAALEFINTAKNSQGLGAKDPKGNFLGECKTYLAQCDAYGVEHCTMLESQDEDADGIIDVCDNCPEDFNPEQWMFEGDDTDGGAGFSGDGFGAVCDTCPTSWNPTQFDLDGDGLSFPCDRCDNDPDPTHQDNDHDGLCEDVDNCPTHFNPGQENCNRLAEEHRDPVVVWGDACDPVPCPEQIGVVRPGEVLSFHEDGMVATHTSTNLWDELEIRPLGSHSSPDHPMVPDAAVNDVVTTVRYCISTGPHGLPCDTPEDIQDERLLDSTCAPTVAVPQPSCDYETYSDHFHRMTFTYGGNGSNPNGAPAVLDYDQLVGSPIDGVPLRWDFEADVARWSAPGIGFLAATPPSHGALGGTLWLHAETAAGSTPSWPQGDHGDHLANHYDLDFWPEEVVHHYSINFAWAPEIFFLWATLPDPEAQLFQRWDANPGETSIVVPVASHWAAIDRGGRGEVVTDRVMPGLAGSVNEHSNMVWVNAAEAFSHQGAGPEFPLAVGLSSSGSQIVEVVRTDGDKLYGLADAGEAAPALHATYGAPNVRGFKPVLSRHAQGVFVVGGTQVGSTYPTAEIWFHRFGETDFWMPLAASPLPSQVLAATYDFATEELFVLAKDVVGTARTVRLYGVKVPDGIVRPIHTWSVTSAGAAWERHSLSVDQAGHLLLAMSRVGTMGEETDTVQEEGQPDCGKQAAWHALFRIDVGSSTPGVLGFRRERRPFAYPPVADASGFTRVVQRRDGTLAVAWVRELTLADGGWSTIQEHM